MHFMKESVCYRWQAVAQSHYDYIPPLIYTACGPPNSQLTSLSKYHLNLFVKKKRKKKKKKQIKYHLFPLPFAYI